MPNLCPPCFGPILVVCCSRCAPRPGSSHLLQAVSISSASDCYSSHTQSEAYGPESVTAKELTGRTSHWRPHSLPFVGWADWVGCRCFLFFVFLGVWSFLNTACHAACQARQSQHSEVPCVTLTWILAGGQHRHTYWPRPCMIWSRQHLRIARTVHCSTRSSLPCERYDSSHEQQPVPAW